MKDQMLCYLCECVSPIPQLKDFRNIGHDKPSSPSANFFKLMCIRCLVNFSFPSSPTNTSNNTINAVSSSILPALAPTYGPPKGGTYLIPFTFSTNSSLVTTGVPSVNT